MKYPTVEEVEQIAERFAEHQITQRSETEHVKYFKFAEPGTPNYCMYIVETEHGVMAHGDIGEIAFDFKSLGWLRNQVIRSTGRITWGYIDEKIPRGIKMEQFCVETARELLLELIEEKRQELVEDGESTSELDEIDLDDLQPVSGEQFYELAAEIHGYYEGSSPTVIEPSIAAQIVGFREFFKKLDEVQTETAAQ